MFLILGRPDPLACALGGAPSLVCGPRGAPTVAAILMPTGGRGKKFLPPSEWSEAGHRLIQRREHERKPRLGAWRAAGAKALLKQPRDRSTAAIYERPAFRGIAQPGTGAALPLRCLDAVSELSSRLPTVQGASQRAAARAGEQGIMPCISGQRPLENAKMADTSVRTLHFYRVGFWKVRPGANTNHANGLFNFAIPGTLPEQEIGNPSRIVQNAPNCASRQSRHLLAVHPAPEKAPSESR